MSARAARRVPAKERARRESLDEAGHEVVVFSVGNTRHAVARASVLAIRPSPRLRSSLPGVAHASSLPLISLSSVLWLERDASVDRRVIEVLHWGEQLGLEVTALHGIRRLPPERMHALPPLLRRCVPSRAVLGIGEWDDMRVVVLDLPTLLVERGVEASRGGG